MTQKIEELATSLYISHLVHDGSLIPKYIFQLVHNESLTPKYISYYALILQPMFFILGFLFPVTTEVHPPSLGLHPLSPPNYHTIFTLEKMPVLDVVKGGCKPQCHWLDNECPINLKKFLDVQNIQVQLTAPHDHWV